MMEEIGEEELLDFVKTIDEIDEYGEIAEDVMLEAAVEAEEVEVEMNDTMMTGEEKEEDDDDDENMRGEYDDAWMAETDEVLETSSFDKLGC